MKISDAEVQEHYSKYAKENEFFTIPKALDTVTKTISLLNTDM